MKELKRGDVFEIDGVNFVICAVNYNDLRLICMANWNRWNSKNLYGKTYNYLKEKSKSYCHELKYVGRNV